MPPAGRLGDKAQVPADAHGCPACPHPAMGPATSGSKNVQINGMPALRVRDHGVHAACCGANTWEAVAGAPTVFINGVAAYRMNDPAQHCGGMGKLIEGSDNVIIGNAGGGGGGSAPTSQHTKPGPAMLGGTVTDGQKPLGKSEVTLSDGRKVTADDQGRFDFGAVDPKEYTVEATFEGWKGSNQVTVEENTSRDVTITITTSLKLIRSPKKIIYNYNESITFTAAATPPAPAGAQFHWFVDGVEDKTQTGASYTKGLQPAATVAERRKEYVVSVRALAATARIEHVRVAQNANVGTANVAASQAGMDTYSYTDTSPTQFDTGLTTAEDSWLQTNYALTRQVLSKTLADGTTQYGRLQWGTASGDLDTTGWNYRSAAIIVARASALKWNKEEFDSMLDHELQHCAHRTSSTSPTTIWKKLWVGGFNTTFSPFTEMFGYYQYVQSTVVSFKFLVDYGAIGSFIREYNAAKTALGTLSGATKADSTALIQGCYDGAQFSELREAVTEGWDHHIDKP